MDQYTIQTFLAGVAAVVSIYGIVKLCKILLKGWIRDIVFETIDDSDKIWRLTDAIKNHGEHIKDIEDSLSEEE